MVEITTPKRAMWAFGYFGFIAVVCITLYVINKTGLHYQNWDLFDWAVVIFVSLCLGVGYYLLLCYYVQAWCIRWESRQIARQGKAIKDKNTVIKNNPEVNQNTNPAISVIPQEQGQANAAKTEGEGKNVA